MNDIAKSIRKIRSQRGITQDTLAEQLHVTRQAVSNWETGKNQPDLDMLERISRALDVVIDNVTAFFRDTTGFGLRLACTYLPFRSGITDGTAVNFSPASPWGSGSAK